MSELKITREELIKICEDSVVECKDWHDRDSCSTQYQLMDIHALLNAKAEFKYHIEGDTIWLNFNNIEDIKDKIKYSLVVDDIDDFFAIDDNEGREMFDADTTPLDYTTGRFCGYLPTRNRLNQSKDDDWC